MRLIFSKDRIKREITAPFAICASVEDLDDFIRALQEARAALVVNGGTYGWVRIDPAHPSDAPANTKPLLWTEVRTINPPSDYVVR